MKKKKRKLNLKKTIKLLIFILILFLIIVKIIPKRIKPEQIKTINVEVTPKEYSLSLAMVGDALINDNIYNDAKNNNYDFSPYLRLIKERIKDYDIKYYNQETILGGKELGLSSYPAFNSPWEFGDAMIDTGFNTVSLATNHTMDRGEKAILKSREYWNNQKDVYSVGSYTSIEEKNEIESKIYAKNGIKYAILNYTYGTNGIIVPKEKAYLVNLWDVTKNYEGYKEIVKKDIENIRDKVDVLIVAMHWGVEYTHDPTNNQKEIAKFLADNDVDIIIGTHPHVIEPVEFIDETLVIYSLGNFISAQTSDSCINYKCSIGMLTTLNITKKEDQISISNIENELIYTYHNNYKDYLVIPFSNSEIKTHLNNYQELYNKYTKIIDTEDKRIKTVPLTN